MQINIVTPLNFQNYKGHLKYNITSFSQKKLSDSEKLTKSLETLSNMGAAHTEISARTQTTVESSKEKSNTQNTREVFEIIKRIISDSHDVKRIIDNAKYKYITGQKILKHANKLINRFVTGSCIDKRNNIDGYPYSAKLRDNCLYIDSLYKGEEFYEEDSFPAPPEIHVTYKEKDDETGIKFIAKSKIGADKYEVFPYEEEGSFNLKRILPDNTIETYSFRNNGKLFEYKKYNTLKKEEVTSLSVLENNIIEYKDKKKDPVGINLRVNSNEGCVYVKNNNDEEKIYVDDGIINYLLGRN